MSNDQPGLLRRLVGPEARRIAAQHQQLDELYALVRTALEAGEAERARERLELFAGGVDAHFTLEESFYFPALHGLEPGLTPELARLEADHRRIRDLLDDLARRAAQHGAPEREAGALEALVEDLRRHEAHEESLVAALGTPPAR